MLIKFIILGQPQSKANSRQLVTINDHPAFVKSKAALAYERDALLQIPPKARLALTCDVRVTIRIFYTTQLPDLDESLILDVLQHRWKGKGEKRQLIQRGVYANDRQVREKHVFHRIDRANPRAEIEIEPLGAININLFAEAEEAACST